MKEPSSKKDPQKALLLSLCPGLGFLYLENILLWITFLILPFIPLVGINVMGRKAIIVSFLLYGLSIFFAYNQANESIKIQNKYKKDPYYIMCLSVLYDGLGQMHLKHGKKAYVMMCLGLAPCMIVWIILCYKIGFMNILMSEKGTTLYLVANGMVIWLIAAIPIKILSLIDAYYSTFHLYVAKK